MAKINGEMAAAKKAYSASTLPRAARRHNAPRSAAPRARQHLRRHKHRAIYINGSSISINKYR